MRVASARSRVFRLNPDVFRLIMTRLLFAEYGCAGGGGAWRVGLGVRLSGRCNC